MRAASAAYSAANKAGVVVVAIAAIVPGVITTNGIASIESPAMDAKATSA